MVELIIGGMIFLSLATYVLSKIIKEYKRQKRFDP